MLLVAAGNVWFGTWFVYRYLAWPTRLWQRKLDARTPAELLAKAYKAPFLQTFIGAISVVLLVVYGSAVFKGAAVMVAGVTAWKTTCQKLAPDARRASITPSSISSKLSE